jgi:hypothetical protein
MSASVQETEPFTLLRTKLHRPRVSHDLVPRPRLVERLHRGLERNAMRYWTIDDRRRTKNLRHPSLVFRPPSLVLLR